MERPQTWATSGDPAELPNVGAPGKPTGGRDVFVYFIRSAKERNSAAAMTLQA